ncbi:MAG TPA: T9SS type A sorting domain-containing protein [Paludibacteraceae bacterium]|nr:T9SS type A sorting domain-containing protein [Paludibacteraceae bacterium]MBP8781958.1 T9SS type A sorting domain-containing protein [Paludibacteraceae bacterium]HNZ84919.1 T9SS type A sorting domain-containing protein [Paludibacteraceae bacterium]
MKKIISSILLAYIFVSSGFAMTHMRVEKNDASEEVIQLNTIRTIRFQGENVQFNYKNGNSDLFAANTLKSLQFSSIPSSIEEKTSAELFFYPNPATDYIYLKNLATEEAMISIYQIDGVIVMKGKQSLHTGIYVGNLASGLYLLEVNKQTYKFRKL